MSHRESMTIEVDEIETTSGTVETNTVTVSFTSHWDSAPDLGAFLVVEDIEVEDIEVEHEGRGLDLTPDEYDSFAELIASKLDGSLAA